MRYVPLAPPAGIAVPATVNMREMGSRSRAACSSGSPSSSACSWSACSSIGRLRRCRRDGRCGRIRLWDERRRKEPAGGAAWRSASNSPICSSAEALAAVNTSSKVSQLELVLSSRYWMPVLVPRFCFRFRSNTPGHRTMPRPPRMRWGMRRRTDTSLVAVGHQHRAHRRGCRARVPPRTAGCRCRRCRWRRSCR